MINPKLTFLGDIAFSGLLSEDPTKNPERFKDVAPILQSADIVFANLEVPVKVSESINNYKNLIRYSLPEPTEQLLKLLNIGCVSLANNHIYDCRLDGLKATIEILDKLGIYHTGAGWKQEQTEPVIIKLNGYSIAFLAYVDLSTNPKTEFFPELYINFFELNAVKADIAKVKNKVDKIICSIHWGVDYSNFYTKQQQLQAYELIDEGVDVIMGHHPHTIQPTMVYNDRIIFYSLGQLCFGDFSWEGRLRALKRKTKRGMIASFSNQSLKNPKLISTRELQGNYITIEKNNLQKNLNYLQSINKLKNKNTIVNLIITIKETYIDRLYEYFFGYYRNPLKETFNYKNFNKVKFMARDFRKNLFMTK